MSIKNIVKRVLLRHKFNSDTYIKYLRSKGIRIGEGTVIFNPQRTWIDETRPWMVEIGENVQITDGVTILTHGYDWSVLKGVYGNVLGSAGQVKIGNNVFIGMNSTILKETTIGDNVIIGANSLVNKDVPSNSVVAGNPARVIMDLDTYFHKRLDAQLTEAKKLVISYYEYYKKIPSKPVLYEFFWLFTDSADNEILPEKWNETMHLVRNYDQSLKKWKESKPKFKNYDEFISWCIKDID